MKVNDFTRISTNGESPKSVKLNWNNHKINFINSPVNSSRYPNIPVAIRNSNKIAPKADLI
jgi:hypothetical protein